MPLNPLPNQLDIPYGGVWLRRRFGTGTVNATDLKVFELPHDAVIHDGYIRNDVPATGTLQAVTLNLENDGGDVSLITAAPMQTATHVDEMVEASKHQLVVAAGGAGDTVLVALDTANTAITAEATVEVGIFVSRFNVQEA